MYNSLLCIELLREVELLAFADDLAIVATAKMTREVEGHLEEAFSRVMEWMSEHELCLVVEKTEAVVFTNKKVNNTMNVNCGGYNILSKTSLRYLRV